MGWSILLSGIAVNVAGVISIKFAQHAQHQALGVLGYATYFVGFVIISFSFKYLDMSLAYALWSGLGSLLVIGIGVLFFNEHLSPSKILFFTFIMVGVAGISLANSG